MLVVGSLHVIFGGTQAQLNLSSKLFITGMHACVISSYYIINFLKKT